jgi:hypothetical protein
MDQEQKFPSYSIKELCTVYKVSNKTMNKWLLTVPDLGVYVGKRFTPMQVKKIFNQLEKP